MKFFTDGHMRKAVRRKAAGVSGLTPSGLRFMTYGYVAIVEAMTTKATKLYE